MSTFNNDTPAAKWRVEGQPDPHEGKYGGKRSELSLGDMTDDELANAVFMFGDVRPKVEDLIAGTAKPSIVYLTAGKERIRWLSRQLEKSLEMQARLTRVIGERDQSITELLEMVKILSNELFQTIDECNDQRLSRVRCDQLDPPDLIDMESVHLAQVLLKRYEEGGDYVD